MNAPEKIVIMDGEIHRTEKIYKNDIEYIRKDDLLKWAKEQEEIMKCGGRVLISDIIAKIESL